jgi:nitrate/nitrite-specific signal transduction histidine kinase
MKVKIKDWSIIRKFSAIYLCIIVVSFSSYFFVLLFSNQQKSDAALVDISGRNRMLSQRIGAMGIMINNTDLKIVNTAREELRKATILHYQSIQAMKNGGISPGYEGTIILPAASSFVLPKLTEIEEYFLTQKKLAQVLIEESPTVEVSSSDSSGKVTITSMPNPKFQKAFTAFQLRYMDGALLKMNAELTQLFVLQAKNSQDKFNYYLVILMVVNMSVIGFAFVFLKKTLKPLKHITSKIKTLSEGMIPDLMEGTKTDEVGQITEAINLLSLNLKSATEFAQNIGEGNLDTSIVVFNNNGDLSRALNVMRENLKKISEEDRKMNWTTEGLAKFSETLRSSDDLKVLCDNLISKLVKYLGACHGSLFLLDDKNQKHLELFSCYAFDRKKFIEKQFELGEGLVGQTYLEAETIYMTDLPDDYIKITSGLGESNPRSLLIVPMKSNDVIEGVLELASFKEFANHEIVFIEKLGENIASILSSMKINEKTKTLLIESKQQAEEMRAQEEEMRQNMEELSATQEEMQRKEKEYLKKITDLEEKSTLA